MVAQLQRQVSQPLLNRDHAAQILESWLTVEHPLEDFYVKRISPMARGVKLEEFGSDRYVCVIADVNAVGYEGCLIPLEFWLNESRDLDARDWLDAGNQWDAQDLEF